MNVWQRFARRLHRWWCGLNGHNWKCLGEEEEGSEEYLFECTRCGDYTSYTADAANLYRMWK